LYPLSFFYKSYTKEEKADVSEKANAVISYTSYTKEEKADVSEKANAVISV
jgi:predicted lactoylglutathione lyase